MTQDGIGAWRGTQSEQAKVTPGFNMQPVPIFSAIGGDPLAWAERAPIFYTFIKKGLGKAARRGAAARARLVRGAVRHQEYRAATVRRRGQALHARRGRQPDADRARPQGDRRPVRLPRRSRARRVVGTPTCPNFVKDLLDVLQDDLQVPGAEPVRGHQARVARRTTRRSSSPPKTRSPTSCAVAGRSRTSTDRQGVAARPAATRVARSSRRPWRTTADDPERRASHRLGADAAPAHPRRSGCAATGRCSR